MLKRVEIRTKEALLLDKGGNILEINSNFTKKLGFEREDLLGENVFNLVAEGFKPFAEKALKIGGEFTVVGRDGRFHRLKAVVEDQRILVYDLSEIPELIRKSYSGVWDFHYGLLFVDERRRIVLANETFYHATGLDKEIEGKRLDDIFDVKIFEELLAEGEVDFSIEIGGKVIGVRAKVREVEICGEKIYEILLRTTDEERLRNLRKTFDDVEYPVLTFISGRLYYSNIAADKTFLSAESIYRLVSEKSAGRIEVETPDGKKEFLFIKIPGMEEIYIFFDLSEQNELLRRLEEELRNYKITFESSVDAIIVTDVSGKILLANSAVKFHGYTPEDLVGRNAFEFILPDHAEKVRRSIENGLSDGIEFKRLEIQIKDRNGKPRWVEVTGSPIVKERGDISGAVVILRDITAKKELERKVQESEELYRTLAENSQAGIFVLQDGKIVYMNRASEEYIGYSREELTGTDAYYNLFEENVRDRIDKIIKKVLEGNSETIFTRYITKSGERRYANLLLVRINFRGKPAILGNFIDVTNMVKAKKRLREREELYRTLAENSHTGIFIIQDDKIVYSNERLREMFGYTVEEINQLDHPYMVVHPDYRDLAISRYRARERGEKVPESYEVKAITKSGEEKWVRVLASQIKYKGKPAVIVNIADVTDLKENEEMLKRVNTLLRVTGELSRSIIHERTEFRIFSNLRTHLEKAGIKVAAFLNEGGLIPISISQGLDEERCGKIANEYLNSAEVVRLREGGGEAIIIPFADLEKTYGIAILFSERVLTDEEVGILSTISRDVVFSIKSLKIEREKEAALRIIVENLNQFEYLADKLRNPLAIIKGYIEVKDDFNFEDFAKKVEEQANRIEGILDELRAREIATYEIKKILDREK